jgi:diguanylate cyclase (GGDEF)-like protein
MPAHSFLVLTRLSVRLRQMGAAEWFDSLTELYNRQGVLDILRELIDRANRYKQDLCLSILDIDHFKSINDRHGQLTGDGVIENVARIIQRNIRATDIAGRYGGDQFIIILPRAKLYSAVVTAERIRNTIENTEMNDPIENVLVITVSQGLSSLEQGEDANSLISRAEEALHKAKENGRNRVEMFQAQA